MHSKVYAPQCKICCCNSERYLKLFIKSQSPSSSRFKVYFTNIKAVAMEDIKIWFMMTKTQLWGVCVWTADISETLGRAMLIWKILLNFSPIHREFLLTLLAYALSRKGCCLIEPSAKCPESPLLSIVVTRHMWLFSTWTYQVQTRNWVLHFSVS